MMVAEPTTTNVTRTAVWKSRRETRPRRGRLGGSRAAATARDETSSSGFDNGVSLRGVALALALGVSTTSTASDALAAVIYVGAGDEAFLEREYVDLKYAGVTDVVPGKMDGKRGVKVEYDADRMSYETLMRVYWRHCEPGQTDGQFSEIGDEFLPVVYAGNEKERNVAESAQRNLEESRIFGNKPLVVPIVDGIPKEFTPSAEREAFKANPKAYGKALAQREKRFKELWGFVQFCYDKVCGYVRFAPKCEGECLSVFPEYEARNSGIPELNQKGIKITSK
jgi:peptide methionine sulfoxide reductase MsrA